MMLATLHAAAESRNPLTPERRMAFYYDRAIAMLKRYFRLSLDLGRMPSLLGREVFRSKVTSYRMISFEDAVIFVHDMEACLARLDPGSRELIARIVLQEYTHEEAAALIGTTRRWLEYAYPRALDRLCDHLVAARLLRAEMCQEAKTVEFPLTDEEQSE